jgi:vitamin B12 transporter
MPFRTSLLRFSAPLLGLLLGAAPLSGVHAQSSAPMEADTFHLREVVVTANRLPTPRVLLPQSITVLEGDDLRARGVHLLADALREVPGAQIVRTGSIGGTVSVFLRGGNSDFVKVLLDGVPLNEPGGRFDFGSFSLENVERIEVVRGPSAVLYGSDAVAGVIQIFTRRGSGEPTLSASASAGSQGSWTGEAGARGALDRFTYSLSVGRTATDGSYPVNNRFSSLVGSGRVSLLPDPRSEVALAIRVQESRYRFPTDGSGNVVDLNQFNFDEGVQLSLDGGRRLSDALEARVQLRASRGERGYENLPDSPADTVGFGYEANRLGTVVRRGAEARFLWSGEGRSLLAGTDWEVERERLLSRTLSNFGGGPSLSSGAFDGNRWNAGLFAQGSLEGPAASRWNAGVRLDRNEVFGSFLTAQAGVVIPLGAAGRVRASVGSAHKAPTFSQQFADTPFEVGNPDLQPETSLGFEAGWDAGFLENRLVVGGSLFHQRYEELIQYGYAGPGLPTYGNVSRAQSRGGELSGVYTASGGQSLGVDYTFTDATLRAPDGGPAPDPSSARLLRRPRHLVAARGRTPLPLGGSLGVTIARVGEREDNDFRSFPSSRVTLGAYTTADLDLQWSLAGAGAAPEGLHLTLRLENALDAEFESVVGFPGMGRRFFTGLRWNP